MTYPTPCGMKNCTRYVNLNRPLPSNLIFVCPRCEDMIVESLMKRMEGVGVIVPGNAEWVMQNVKMFRHEMRKLLPSAAEGMRL